MIIKSIDFIKEPLVSIVVITYNQEKTIAQTIESILSQYCNFSYEIIIGEDCSTDKTRDICRIYQVQYPEKIALLLQDCNQGIIRNYRDVMGLCKGKYIAQCAGDDYWCDKLKLQKQIDFFKKNKEYGFVRTAFKVLNENTGKFSKQSGHSLAVGNVFEIAKYGTIASAPTICFERELLSYIDFKEFVERKFSMEDYPMQAIMAHHTQFGYLPDITAVYRNVAGSESKPANREKKLYYNEGFVAVQKYLSELFPDETDFDENTAGNFILHLKLKFAFEDFNYIKARSISNQIINPGSKEKRLINFTKNRLIFLLGCLYKRLISYMP